MENCSASSLRILLKMISMELRERVRSLVGNFFLEIMCSGNVDLFVWLYLYLNCRWLNINLERKLGILIEAVRDGNV